MTLHENAELNKILKNGNGYAIHPRQPRPPTSYSSHPVSEQGIYYEDEEEEKTTNGFCQWTTTDGGMFFPAGNTAELLPPALYEPKYCPNRGYFFQKLDCKTDGLLEFPETNSKRVVTEIQKFWEKEKSFRAFGLHYKRGMILWGPPGSGKSCTIKLVLRDVLERGGVAVKFNVPQIFLECVRIMRKIQPKSPLVVLMEDIDSIIAEFGETDVLNILDGVEAIDKVVYLATTNYPEQLGARIINRPSRFDRRFKMPHPGKASRKLYFDHLFQHEVLTAENVNIDQWVKDTEGMSIAHLKELFIAVCILGDPYEDVVETLRSMMEDKVSSEEDKIENFGFKTTKSNDD